MSERLIRYFVALFMFSACSTYASAQDLNFKLEDLSLDSVDSTLEEIERRLQLAAFGYSTTGPSSTGSEPSNDTGTQPDLRQDRSPSSPRCFADNFQKLSTTSDMDDYFDQIESKLSDAMDFLNLVLEKQNEDKESECSAPLLGLLMSSSDSIKSIRRSDLADLTFHLELCWPDDSLNEANGGELDVDSRYTRARRILDMHGRADRALQAANEACG